MPDRAPQTRGRGMKLVTIMIAHAAAGMKHDVDGDVGLRSQNDRAGLTHPAMGIAG
jgi:hypothetical protein